MRVGFAGGGAGIIAVAILALEIVGIYQIGQRIGVGWTLVWLVAAVIAGGAVIRRAGAGFLPGLLAAVNQGRAPFALVWATGRYFLAGVLLILPGAASDLLALLLLLWPGPKPGFTQPGRSRAQSGPMGDDGVIEGEYRRMD